MQISAKIWDYLKNNKNLNPFVKFKGILVLGFHLNWNIWPRSDKNIDKDTIFIKFWNANIGKNLGLIEKIIKI